MDLTDERRAEVVSLGTAARALLANDDFTLVLNKIANETTLNMVETPIGAAGRDDREEQHLMLHGLKRVVDAVKQFHIALTNLEHMDLLDAERPDEEEAP